MRLGTAVALLTLTAGALASGWAAAIGQVALLVVFAMAPDAAARVNQAPGQRVIYSLRGEARGRINALYMSIVFMLGAGGSPVAPPAPGLSRGRLARRHAGRGRDRGRGRRPVRDRALEARVGGEDRT